VAGSLRIHRRIGGDLPAVLDRIAATLREREEVTAELHSMTAQARMSGAIVGALPIAFLGVLWVVSRDDVMAGLSTPIGAGAVAIGLALEAGAYLWIRRLLEIR
jgi:tight adherence protein B